MSASSRGKPAADLVETHSCAHRRDRHGQPTILGAREVRTSAGDHPELVPRGHCGQCLVALVILRRAVTGQLDAHLLATEAVDQVDHRSVCVTIGQPTPNVTFAATGQNVPVTARSLGELVEAVLRTTLLAAAQMSSRNCTRQPAVALLSLGKNQQVDALRIGKSRPWIGRIEGEFGAEDRADTVLLCRFSEAHDPV